jgi:hypothetical protein
MHNYTMFVKLFSVTPISGYSNMIYQISNGHTMIIVHGYQIKVYSSINIAMICTSNEQC